MGLPATKQEDPAPDASVVPITPSKHLSIGTALQVTLPYKNATATTYATLHGYRPGSFLLVDLPHHEGVSLGVQVGTRCVARYVLKGRVMGFVAQVRKAQFSPDKLLFLSYPESIQEFSLRREDRLRVRLPAKLNTGALNAAVVVRDLSQSGCGLVLSEDGASIEVGAEAKVCIELVSGEAPVEIDCAVRVAKSVARAGTTAWWIGVEFLFNDTTKPIMSKILDVMERAKASLSTSDL